MLHNYRLCTALALFQCEYKHLLAAITVVLLLCSFNVCKCCTLVIKHCPLELLYSPLKRLHSGFRGWFVIVSQYLPRYSTALLPTTHALMKSASHVLLLLCIQPPSKGCAWASEGCTVTIEYKYSFCWVTNILALASGSTCPASRKGLLEMKIVNKRWSLLWAL